MAGYKVLTPVEHDGELYAPGDDISVSKVGGGEAGKKALRALIEAGAVAKEEDVPKEEEEPEGGWPVDNRPAPDSGPTHGGTARLDTALPEPTNVPEQVEGAAPVTTQPAPSKVITQGKPVNK